MGVERIPAFVDSLLHHPGGVLLAIDEGAVIRWVSRSVTEFLGYQPASLEGTVALDLVHPDSVEDLAVGLSVIAEKEMALGDATSRILDADGAVVEVRMQPIGMVPGDDGPLLVMWIRHVDLERQLLDTFRLLAEGAAWDEVIAAVLGCVRPSDGVRLSFHRWTGPASDRTVVSPGEERWGEEVSTRWAQAVALHDTGSLQRLPEPTWCPADELKRYSSSLAECAAATGHSVVHFSPLLVGGDDTFGLLISWYDGEVNDAQRHLFTRHDALRAAALRTAWQRDRGVAVLRAAARTDPLTGLLNRAGLLEALDRQREGAVLFIDLDRFKPVNDRLGHRVGDLVLEEVARRLGSVCRGSDIVGRLGGDEFVVVAPGVGPGIADDLRCRLMSTLNRPASIDGHMVDIRATVGLADIESGVAGTALDRADADMLRRKPGAQDRVQSPSLDVPDAPPPGSFDTPMA
ncbi:MAG: sensor domain-containing diguanylate cyclase [Microthrixaceae bacterium]